MVDAHANLQGFAGPAARRTLTGPVLLIGVSEEWGLQRFFSTFPGGAPGIGLLLLRIVAGVTTVAQGAACITLADMPMPVTWAAGLAAILGGALLLIGLVTPLAGGAASLSVALIALSSFNDQPPGLFLDLVATMCVTLVAASLVLTGPGSLSIDARLFGRREIVFPDHRR